MFSTNAECQLADATAAGKSQTNKGQLLLLLLKLEKHGLCRDGGGGYRRLLFLPKR